MGLPLGIQEGTQGQVSYIKEVLNMPVIKLSHGYIKNESFSSALKKNTMTLTRAITNGYTKNGFAFYRGRLYSNNGVDGCLDLLGTDEDGNFIKVQIIIKNIASPTASLVYGRKVAPLSTGGEVIDCARNILILVGAMNVSKVYFDFCDSQNMDIRVFYVTENDPSAGACEVLFVDRGSYFYESYMLSDAKSYIRGTCLGEKFHDIYKYYEKLETLVATNGNKADIQKHERVLANHGINV